MEVINIPIIFIHDITNPATGNTYKEDNLKLKHKFEIGDLVELGSGVRLFIAAQNRDCDGSLLYSLTIDLEDYFFYMKECNEGFSTLAGTAIGYPEESLTLIRKAAKPGANK